MILLLLFNLLFLVFAQEPIQFDSTTKTLTINKEGIITKFEISKFCFDNQIEEEQILKTHLGKNTLIDSHSFNKLKILQDISVDEQNKYYTVTNKVLFSKDSKRLIYYPPMRTSNHYTIPEGVEIISPYAFSANTFVFNINFPMSLKRIEEQAFLNSLYSSSSILQFYGIDEPVCENGAFPISTNVRVPQNYKSEQFCTLGISRQLPEVTIGE